MKSWVFLKKKWSHLAIVLMLAICGLDTFIKNDLFLVFSVIVLAIFSAAMYFITAKERHRKKSESVA